MVERGQDGAIEQAWRALTGGRAERPDRLRIEGHRDGYLPSALPVFELAVACAGVALQAAAELGEVPSARLRTDHVAAAMRSERHLRRDGAPAAMGFAPLSRFWQARDGWIRTHANYPRHRDALLGELGAPEALEDTLSRWSARELEDRITAAGGIAVAVRSHQEWRATAQGREIASQPLVIRERIGSAPPRPRPAGRLPASGVRVLDLTRVIAGPVCTRFLGALGADVLRLDSPHLPELSDSHDALLGKRSALLDFRTREGYERLHALLRDADVLVHAYRPGSLEDYGLAADELADRYPGLVTVSLSAWGTTGPWGGRRGFDSIVQAATGIAMLASDDGERPGALPCQLLDHGTGYLSAAAALEALREQRMLGGTHRRRLALAGTAHWLLDRPRPGLDSPERTEDVAAWRQPIDDRTEAIAPPGEFGEHGLHWRRAGEYGADPPVW